MKKKLIFLLIGILLISLVAVGCGSGDTGQEEQGEQQEQQEDLSLEEIKEKGKFVLGLDDSFPPMGFRDEKGEIVGFDIDLAREVAERMGVEVELKPIDWSANILSLNNKDIDVIWNGLTITESRKKEIEFSKPYLANRQIIITQAGSDIKTKADLAGKIVGVQLGSSAEEALNADTETAETLKEIMKYGNYTEALLDLKAGRVDAVVMDEVVGKYYISKKPGEYAIAEEDFGYEEYGIGFRKGDIAFRDEVNRILDEIIADGTAAEISKKWFGEDIVLK
ncbi:MAG TPA: amino acid ABC transporter substrate-binding protein [Clostridiales bacterium]|nr:amino acid ABC transporter substrate-binding protein [Clostridiales bacterium]